MKILLLDNYDSFTYNLYQYLIEISNSDVDVIRNDQISIEEVGQYDVIILSPGPGLPKEAGIMPEIIATYFTKIPILGICLGHQAIGEAFGSKLLNLENVYHGVSTPIQIVKDSEIFKNIDQSFEAGRYHSWVIDKTTLSDQLEITAEDSEEMIMAIKHINYPVYGLQFHPESIMTEEGKIMLRNFMNIVNQN